MMFFQVFFIFEILNMGSCAYLLTLKKQPPPAQAHTHNHWERKKKNQASQPASESASKHNNRDIKIFRYVVYVYFIIHFTCIQLETQSYLECHLSFSLCIYTSYWIKFLVLAVCWQYEFFVAHFISLTFFNFSSDVPHIGWEKNLHWLV